MLEGERSMAVSNTKIGEKGTFLHRPSLLHHTCTHPIRDRHLLLMSEILSLVFPRAPRACHISKLTPLSFTFTHSLSIFFSSPTLPVTCYHNRLDSLGSSTWYLARHPPSQSPSSLSENSWGSLLGRALDFRTSRQILSRDLNVRHGRVEEQDGSPDHKWQGIEGVECLFGTRGACSKLKRASTLVIFSFGRCYYNLKPLWC